MADSISPSAESAALRQRLTELRAAVQQLHKTLLDSERLSYEASFGRTV